MAQAQSDAEKDLGRLEAELKRLEAEYNMFFAGRLPKPPWETRNRVESMVRRLDRQRIQNYGVRFRFVTLQSRFAAFVDLWDRGQRAREEGRSGPFVRGGGQADPTERAAAAPDVRVLYVTAFQDPGRERDKLEGLYESVSAARRDAGAAPVPFDKFAALVKSHVDRLHAAGTPEVAFRVALKDGKVSFTARPLRSGADGDDDAND